MYTIVNQIIPVVCEIAPATNEVGAFQYVSFPAQMNIKRITIYIQLDPTSTITLVNGGLSFTRETDVRNYMIFGDATVIGFQVPFKMEVTNENDAIKGGIYLSTLGTVPGEGTIFVLVFEGEQ